MTKSDTERGPLPVEDATGGGDQILEGRGEEESEEAKMMTEPTTVSGRGHGIPVSVPLVLIVAFVFLYCSCESREHFAKRLAEHHAKTQAAEECFDKATNELSECLDRQGLSQDFRDEDFKSEEYAECSKAWVGATDCGGFNSFSTMVDGTGTVLKKGGCEAHVAIRWVKCVEERVLDGRSDKKARTDCRLALYMALPACAYPDSRNTDSPDVWERALQGRREWDARRTQEGAEVLEGRGEAEGEEEGGVK